jgi:hypothetical protein
MKMNKHNNQQVNNNVKSTKLSLILTFDDKLGRCLHLASWVGSTAGEGARIFLICGSNEKYNICAFMNHLQQEYTIIYL